MREHEHQQVIAKLQQVIDDTQATLCRAEDHGLDVSMPGDYAHLLDILDNAIKQQREHTNVMLFSTEGGASR
ncbi:hypothetical protein [Vreelandella sp. EE27]